MATESTQQPNDDALCILREEFRATLLAFGMSCPPEVEQAFIDRAVHRVGGGQVYVPRQSAQARREKHQYVREQWNGRNTHELSRATGLSLRRIQQLVNQRPPAVCAK